jgi:type I restriction enzyme R subunit
VVDYDYIMGLIAKSTQKSGKQTMSRAQIIELISASANLIEERADIIEYINSLPIGEALNEKAIREGYQAFKAQKATAALSAIAQQHGFTLPALQGFVDGVLDRMIFDGEQLTDLFAPLGLNWKERRVAELGAQIAAEYGGRVGRLLLVRVLVQIGRS